MVQFTEPSPFVVEIDLSEKTHMRTQNYIPGFPLGEPGRYFFQFEVQSGKEWKTVARVPYVLTVEYGDDVTAPETAPKKPTKKRSPKRRK